MICTSHQRVIWMEHAIFMGLKTGKPWALVGESEGKETLGRIRRRKKDDIKKDLQEIGLGAGTKLVWIRREASGKLL